MPRQQPFPSSPLHIHLALNLHLDRPRLGIRRRLKRSDRILNVKPMRDQSMQIHDPALDQSNGAGPRVGVAVLELEVDLLGAEAHKGELHLGLADPDDEDLAAELDAVDGRVDTALDARALERNGRLHPACQVDDFLPRLLDPDAPFHLEGPHAGDELLCEGQPPLVDVGHNNRFRPGRGGAQEGDQADGSGAADQYRVTQFDAGPLDTRQGHAQRFEQGSVLEAHVANLVAPLGWVVHVSSQEAVNRWCGQETHV